MVIGLQDVYLNVPEMGPAVQFYRDVLGRSLGDPASQKSIMASPGK
jgi:hypothetical protein